MRLTCIFICFMAFAGCSVNKNSENSPEPVLVGLDGRKFFKPELQNQPKLDSNYAVALKNFQDNPSEENYIWLGRREAYRYNHKEAIEIFTRGLQRYPESYKLYRHRGHRYITTRDFKSAISDLQHAVDLMPADTIEIEPDGIPNKINTPLSSVAFNIWYHLGLAHYLSGDFKNAEEAYQQCMTVSNNDDLLCATADWLYMALRRQKKNDEAAKLLERITGTMNIIENDSYHKRLLMYKGLLKPEELLEVGDETADKDLAIATQGYGVGNWYLCNGDSAKAKEVFQKVVEGKHFSAFGFIAAEAELVRMK
jgi:tetratricopeptide (TPR) repeat protein